MDILNELVDGRRDGLTISVSEGLAVPRSTESANSSCSLTLLKVAIQTVSTALPAIALVELQGLTSPSDVGSTQRMETPSCIHYNEMYSGGWNCVYVYESSFSHLTRHRFMGYLQGAIHE